MTEAAQTRGRGWPLVILAALAVLLFFFALLPAGALFVAQSDEAGDAQRQIAVYRALIAARPQLQAELDAINRQQAPAAALLQGSSTPLAAASMQSLVKAMVERHGGQIRSAQTLAASTAGGLEKVIVQYEVSLPLGGLKAATYELETGTPYLFVDEAEIRPELYTGGTTGAPGNLHVSWTVHGYRRMGPP